ncbi:MAG: hypothetical protein ACXWCP_30995, partial [Burkholderiales bacterium]
MSHRIRTFSVISLFTLLTGLFTYAAPSEPTAVTPDGGRYFGALVNGKFDGTGRIEWDNGSSYEGSFSQGYFSGRGLMRWPSGQRYAEHWTHLFLLTRTVMSEGCTNSGVMLASDRQLLQRPIVGAREQRRRR